jgi:hypothetical protein
LGEKYIEVTTTKQLPLLLVHFDPMDITTFIKAAQDTIRKDTKLFLEWCLNSLGHKVTYKFTEHSLSSFAKPVVSR